MEIDGQPGRQLREILPELIRYEIMNAYLVRLALTHLMELRRIKSSKLWPVNCQAVRVGVPQVHKPNVVIPH